MVGELIVVDDFPGEFSERVVEAYHSRPEDTFSLMLSGGRTARRCYERLAVEAEREVDWWKVDLYWGDERCVPQDHPDSNYQLARSALLDRVGAANATYPLFCDEGPEPYQLRLGELGRIDLVHLGLGTDGHTASLFAGTEALEAPPGLLVTRTADPTGLYPHERLTLTFEGLARARLVLVTVAGEEKAEALARVLAGDDAMPASRLRSERVVWLADRAAAASLA